MNLSTKVSVFFLIIVVIFSIFLLSQPRNTHDSQKKKYQVNDLRGVWVATVLNIDYPNQPTTSPKVLKEEALEILDKVNKVGFNTVFLQVRPSSDAIYKSVIFPWSEYLTGTQGLPPAEDFDPLQFWIEEAHKRNIELHAWINPYRITKNRPGDSKHSYESLALTNPAILNNDWVVQHKDGNLYYNPGIPEVRDMIVNSTIELLQNYQLDGIHMDDYFYPNAEFEDEATFNNQNTNYDNIHDWRRANVTMLVKELSKVIKETSSTARFGISPFGIWANKESNALGSNTQGTESLNEHYADTRGWVREGLLDYIAPQLYWHIGFKIADYSELLAWWAEVVQDTDVALYIGHAAYKAGDKDINSVWHGVDELHNQLELSKNTAQVKGSIFFSYRSFINNATLTKMLQDYYLEND